MYGSGSLFPQIRVRSTWREREYAIFFPRHVEAGFLDVHNVACFEVAHLNSFLCCAEWMVDFMTKSNPSRPLFNIVTLGIALIFFLPFFFGWWGVLCRETQKRASRSFKTCSKKCFSATWVASHLPLRTPTFVTPTPISRILLVTRTTINKTILIWILAKTRATVATQPAEISDYVCVTFRGMDGEERESWFLVKRAQSLVPRCLLFAMGWYKSSTGQGSTRNPVVWDDSKSLNPEFMMVVF